jgi:glycosyltransferase involved in cell wall biosynthesis
MDAAHAAGLDLVLAGKCAEKVEVEYFEREVRPRLREGDVLFGMADAREKRGLLGRARALLMPIQWEEPFGMVMIEAMACGTPVVALRAGAVPEIVVDGVTGFVCDDLESFAAAIGEASRLDPADCRDHVATRFSVDRMAREHEQAYLRASEPAPAPLVPHVLKAI